MSTEDYLESKLRKFSILDLSLVKAVYFFFSLLIFSLYPVLGAVDWWFYLILSLMCALPLYVHMFSQKGNLIAKMHAYLKTNNPSNQVLLFLSVFFFSVMIAILIPYMTTCPWWVYLGFMAVLAIKPLTKSWCW